MNRFEVEAAQLGMNKSTASAKLLKDILFSFVQKAGHKCFRCGGELTRETFSIEHMKEWLHEPNAQELFFDLKNIAYSHRRCNTVAARRPNKKYLDKLSKYKANFKSWWNTLTPEQKRERRRQNYLRNGC